MASSPITFKELLDYSTGKANASRQEFESAMASRGYGKGDIRKLGRAFDRVKESGNSYLLHPEKGFNVYDPTGKQLKGSGRNRGNRAGTDLGDLIGLGGDVSLLAGALRNEVKGYTASKQPKAPEVKPEPVAKTDTNPTPTATSQKASATSTVTAQRGIPAVQKSYPANTGKKSAPAKETTDYSEYVRAPKTEPVKGPQIGSYKDLLDPSGKYMTDNPPAQEFSDFEKAFPWLTPLHWESKLNPFSQEANAKVRRRNLEAWQDEHPGETFNPNNPRHNLDLYGPGISPGELVNPGFGPLYEMMKASKLGRFLRGNPNELEQQLFRNERVLRKAAGAVPEAASKVPNMFRNTIRFPSSEVVPETDPARLLGAGAKRLGSGAKRLGPGAKRIPESAESLRSTRYMPESASEYFPEWAGDYRDGGLIPDDISFPSLKTDVFGQPLAMEEGDILMSAEHGGLLPTEKDFATLPTNALGELLATEEGEILLSARRGAKLPTYDDGGFMASTPSVRGSLDLSLLDKDFFPATQRERSVGKGIDPEGNLGRGEGFDWGGLASGLVKYGAPAAYLAAEQGQIHNLRQYLNPEITAPDLMVGAVKDLPHPDFSLPYRPEMEGSSLAESQANGLARAKFQREGRIDWEQRNALNRQQQLNSIIDRINQNAILKSNASNQTKMIRSGNSMNELGYLFQDRGQTAGSLFHNLDQGINNGRIAKDRNKTLAATHIIESPNSSPEDIAWAKEILGVGTRRKGGKLKIKAYKNA